MRIELRTISVPSGAACDVAVVTASSKWATFGGDHPQDMLLPALRQWAEAIVRR